MLQGCYGHFEWRRKILGAWRNLKNKDLTPKFQGNFVTCQVLTPSLEIVKFPNPGKKSKVNK